MKEIKKRIFSKKLENPFAEITYLTMVDEGKDEQGFGQMSIKPVRKTEKLETYRVKTKVSKEAVLDMEKLHGLNSINHQEMIKSVLENESSMMQQKLIRDMIAFAGEQSYKETYTKFQMFCHNWFGYVPKIRIKTEDKIFYKIISLSNLIATRSRRGPADYIIVSPGMGARIMDLPQFVHNDPNQPNLDMGTGNIYQSGNLANRISVLIDPNAAYNDNRIILGSNIKEAEEGIYHAYMEPTFETFEAVPTLEMPYITTVLSQRMALIPTDNAHLRYLTFEITDKPHNIITHLINKIFKK